MTTPRSAPSPRPGYLRLLAAVIATTALFAVQVPAASAKPPTSGRAGTTPAFTWGYNNAGALGIGSTAGAKTPTPTMLPTGATQVAAGIGFTLALTRAGTVLGWGENRWGQLGNGSNSYQWAAVPVNIPGRTRVIAIDAAGEHALAVTADGRVYAWGRNIDGQLGDGTTIDRSTPVPVATPSGIRIIQVAAGTDHSLAVTSSGQVLAWGHNNQGQLTGTPGSDKLRPTPVHLPSPIVKLAAGDSHSVALTKAGSILTWGNPAGTQGAATGGDAALRRVAIPGGSPVAAIDAGAGHSTALTRSGQVYSWGDDSRAQLGDGSHTDRVTPTRVKGLGPIVAISTAGDHTVALDNHGNLWTWGDNRYGQIGDGGTDEATTPLRVTALAGAHVVSVYTGEYHTVVIVSRGPLSGITLTPANSTIRPGQRQAFQVKGFDAFGQYLGNLTGQAALRAEQGSCRRNVCTASTAGTHRIIAIIGLHLAGAALTVRRAATGTTTAAAPSSPPPRTSTTTSSPRASVLTSAAASVTGPSTSRSVIAAPGPADHNGLYANSPDLANTGTPAAALLATAVTLLAGGVLMMRLRRPRRTGATHRSDRPDHGGARS
jgi:alpha-tubulin suppressor-like RCC1 family protein